MLVRFAILVLITFAGSGIFAQEVSGYIEDAANKEPVPFANVWIKGTQRGTMSDINGFFKLSASTNDIISFSSVGYIPQEIPVRDIAGKRLTVLLERDVRLIHEVTVKPEIPRARVLFNEILRHKKENREKVLGLTDYKSVENTTVYIAVDTTSRMIRSFGNLDDITVKIDNQDLRFSPVYLFEQARDVAGNQAEVVHHKKNSIFPRLNQAFESVILKNVVVDLDFYKDQIVILDRGFISPLSNSALSHYNLYLNDSVMIDSTKYFNFSYAPKNKYNQLFSGQFVIEDGSFALTRIDAYISREANLNFVNGFQGNVSYSKLPDGRWFYHEQKIDINLALTLNKDSVSNYSSKRVEQVSSGNWLISRSTRYSTSERLEQVNAGMWKNQPEFASRKPETDSYAHVDKIKEHDVVKGIDAIGGMVLTSYFNAGKIDIGPVYDIYSTNTIEGSRFSVPLRTSEKLFKNFSVGGFLGYGTRNEEFQFGGNLVYQPLKTDKFVFRFNYSNDYALVSQDKYLRFIKNNPNNKGTGNFIAIFTSREDNPYLKDEESFELRMEYNSPNGTHLEASPYLLSSKSTPAVSFVREGEVYNSYKNYGLLFDVRFTFGQHYDKYYFDRVYYVNPTPVVNLSWDIGQTLLPGESMRNSGFYAQFHGSVQGRINMGQIFMNYIVNAGYLFGDAPYDLLDQPVGSMSLGYAKDRYNLLHFASFAHNLYTNTHLHFNGGGVILNRLPLVRKMKLREILSVKFHHGKLDDSYKGVFDLPGYYTNEFKSPYAEIGFGVTNIFKVLRVEYVHQLNPEYKNRNFTDNGGLRLRAEMSF
ncbi:DUF5686 and carboxypeptidase-like regulatory domain-containing protein [Gaoshiqia sp. Z1-71]|uniref:DUF5686 and carboxypeptidase-like regulatory domain-containing protein n=1 Tax=Gaoshiqia hydrogeniformans TaxID=3290090 RepID=UPI003BF91425